MSIISENLKNQNICIKVREAVEEVYEMKVVLKKPYKLQLNGRNTGYSVDIPENITKEELNVLSEHIAERVGRNCEIRTIHIYLEDIE